MIRSLDKKWKEFVFAASGFGPNLLMVLMGAYYSDALDPAALARKLGYKDGTYEYEYFRALSGISFYARIASIPITLHKRMTSTEIRRRTRNWRNGAQKSCSTPPSQRRSFPRKSPKGSQTPLPRDLTKRRRKLPTPQK